MKIAKWKMVLSSALVLLPGAVCALMGSGLAALIISLALLSGHFLCIFFTVRDPGNREQSSKVFDMLLWIFPVLSVLEAVMLQSIKWGNVIRPTLFVNVLMGLIAIVIGNYLPKTRRNSTIGVKIKWTLENDENWNATHRFTGKVWVCVGVGFLAGACLPEAASVAVLLGLIGVMVIVPLCFSYGYYRRQVAQGGYEKQAASIEVLPKKWSLGIAVVILALVALLMFTGEIRYSFGENALRISATYWQDALVSYAEITDTELLSDYRGGSRSFGFASAKLMMGTFRSTDLGSYTRYTYTGSRSAVVVHTEGETYMLSGKNDFETRMLYETLSGAINP